MFAHRLHASINPRSCVSLGTVAPMALHTVGHGTLPAEQFTALVLEAGVERVIDVTSFPGGRHTPQSAREAMEVWLPESALRYGWLPELGGRRKPLPASLHTALRNDAFRAYA